MLSFIPTLVNNALKKQKAGIEIDVNIFQVHYSKDKNGVEYQIVVFAKSFGYYSVIFKYINDIEVPKLIADICLDLINERKAGLI